MSDEASNVAILKDAYKKWSDTQGGSVDEWMKICSDKIQFGSLAQAPSGASYLTDYDHRDALKQYFNGLQYAYDFTGDGWPDVINAVFQRPALLYVNPKGASRRWESHVVTDTMTCEFMLLKDVDGDGKSEVWYFYRFDEDGADPVAEKMIVYAGNGQLTVKGLIPRMSSDLERYEQSIEKEDQVSATVKTFALKEWERNAIKELKSYNGDDVTKEENFPFKKNIKVFH